MRVVRTPAGSVELDDTGRANGRGAYLCRQASCWSAAATKPILERALNVRLDRTFRERLAAGPDAITPVEPEPAAPEAAHTSNTQGGARGKE